MELRFGALRAGCGELRRRRLERRIADIALVQPGDQMITTCAELRLRCQQAGHALGDKRHDGDRWIAVEVPQNVQPRRGDPGAPDRRWRVARSVGVAHRTGAIPLGAAAALPP